MKVLIIKNFFLFFRLYNKPEDDLKEVKIDLQWSSDLPHFDYDTDMDMLTTAKAFAREPWSKQYFQQLREWV